MVGFDFGETFHFTSLPIYEDDLYDVSELLHREKNCILHVNFFGFCVFVLFCFPKKGLKMALIRHLGRFLHIEQE